MNFEAMEPINIIHKGGLLGIDVSKSKSTVAILDSYGTILSTPFNMAHTQSEMNVLVSRLKAFYESVTILLEYTGHYHYPVLKKFYDEGVPVCVVNPYQIMMRRHTV